MNRRDKGADSYHYGQTKPFRWDLGAPLSRSKLEQQMVNDETKARVALWLPFLLWSMAEFQGQVPVIDRGESVLSREVAPFVRIGKKGHK